MTLVKRLSVYCVPFFLVACTTVPTSSLEPVPEVKKEVKSEAKVEKKIAPKPKHRAVDSVAKAPVAVVTLLKRAEKQQESGNYQAAEASLQRAIRIAPRYPKSYYQLGELRFKQGLYSQAYSLAAKTLSLGADGWLRRKALSLLDKASAH